MSFKPENASLPTSFKKTNSTAKGFQQWPKDRLCIVDGYDLDTKNPANSKILVTEVDTGRKIEAYIPPEKIGEPSSSAPWNGNLIDSRMEAKVPVGSRVVLEKCETKKNIKKPDGTLSIMKCDWIVSMNDPSPEKSFTGNITISSYKDAVTAVQVWEEKAINPATEEGEAELLELCQKIDEINSERAAGHRPVPYGVQFRTIRKLDETDKAGNPVYEVVDCSPPFDWIKEKKDAEGNKISDGSILYGKYVTDNLEKYLDYVFGPKDEDSSDAEPGLVARGIVPEGTELEVEVMIYRAYTAAPLSKYMKIYKEERGRVGAEENEEDRKKTPLYSLAKVMTKYGQDEQTGYMGKNWGVAGIVKLISDAAPKSKGDDWTPRALVDRIFTAGYKGNIHTMVKTSDGNRIKVHPALDRVKDMSIGNSQSYTSARSESVPSLQAPTSIDFDDDDDANSYFANAVNQGSDSGSSQDQDHDQDNHESSQPSQPPKSAGKAKKEGAGSKFRRTT